MKQWIFAAAAMLALSASAWSAEGNFLADRHAAKGMNCASCHVETPPAKAVPTEKCLSCHGDYEKLKELTKDKQPNPHYTHLLDQPCSECHKGHTESVNMCNSCHQFDFKVP